MNVQKYIIYKNIDRFKSMMIDRTQKTFIEFNTYEHYTISKSGHRRSILSQSVKWTKTEGLKNLGVTGLYLLPSTHVNGLNICKFAGLCKKPCIAFTGHLGAFHVETMKKRTLALFHYTERYLEDMVRELFIMAFRASIENKNIYIRLNGTSDLPFHTVLDMDALTNDINGLAGFYDYTKYPRVDNPWKNYHLTYSYSERTKNINAQFDRVAIVVSQETKKQLLTEHPAVFGDGDKHDVRPLDTQRYILLRAKKPTTKGHGPVDQDFMMDINTALEMCVGGVL